VGRKAAKLSPDDLPPYHEALRAIVDKRKGDRSYADVAKQAGLDRRVLSLILTGGRGDIQLETLMAILRSVDSTLCEFEKIRQTMD